MSGKLPIEKLPGEKGFNKPEKIEKLEKEKVEKPERKELKNEAKEFKIEKREIKEVKREKIEIKELKVEIKEHLKSEFEVPPIDFPVGPGPGPGPGPIAGPIGRGFESAPPPGQSPISPEQLAAHADALEEAARQLRHFIAESERPDLGGGALQNEPDEDS